jgi:hypothetical protein
MLALTAAGLVAAAPSGTAATPRSAQGRTPTAFGLTSKGFGTRVAGGQVPAGSKDTAWDNIGCTNLAGITKDNHEAGLDNLPDGLHASAVKTRVWTTEKGAMVSSWAKNTIAEVKLADTPGGTLSLDGLQAVAHAYHDASGYHAKTSSDIGSITLTPPTGDPQSFPAPAPGTPLVIPGVATIIAGWSVQHANGDHATAKGEVLTVQVEGSQSRVHVGHAYARIDGGIRSGIFSGWASGSEAEAADGKVTSGRTPFDPMKCTGTGGRTTHKAIASTDLGGQVVASGLGTAQKTTNSMSRAHGFQEGHAAKLDIGSGQLVVEGIVGRVNVTRKGAGLNTLVRNIKGSTIGSITANGQAKKFPKTDVLEIPGVAKLERNVKTKIPGGMKVTALRVTLLDGTGAVLNLGQAKLSIRKSGL